MYFDIQQHRISALLSADFSDCIPNCAGSDEKCSASYGKPDFLCLWRIAISCTPHDIGGGELLFRTAYRALGKTERKEQKSKEEKL